MYINFQQQFCFKAWFKRRIFYVPNQILILVHSNEYVQLIWIKHRIFLPNKNAEDEECVLNYHLSTHKLFNIIWIWFGTCKIWLLKSTGKLQLYIRLDQSNIRICI